MHSLRSLRNKKELYVWSYEKLQKVQEPLIIESRLTDRYAVSSFSHLHPAVKLNLLAELTSEIDTSVFFILA